MTAPASRKTHRAPQPQDVPEVAHNGHGGPDSRGLVLTPDDDLAWTRGPLGRHSLVPVHGGYSDPEAPTTLRPCFLCGEPARPVPGPDPDYAMCGFPLEWGDGGSVVTACLERAAKERAAVTALIAAPAEPEPATEPVADEPAEPPAKVPAAPRKPRARASTARAKQAAKTAEAAAEDATEPPEGGAA